ncbi:DNA polymerase II [Pseudanabaena phage Pam1]|nr:DNA polymerase II [Pseudanabaena phage Pam1]
MSYVDPNLYDYCDTDKQRETLRLLDELGSGAAVAERLGVHRSWPSGLVKRLKQKAARRGYSPDHNMTRTVPEGYLVKGVSTYFDSDGKPRGQWVKSSIDAEKQKELIQATVAAMVGEITPVAPIVAPEASQGNLEDLCNLYTYSDFHLGMLAQEEEGGANWDLKIAEDTLVRSFQMMLDQSPKASCAVVNIQGDMLHSDGLLPVTPTNRHVLDQDGRFSRIVATAIRSIRQLCRMALERHQQVHLVICEGNHDEASSVWLRLMFEALYEQEPRLTVNASELPFYVFEWGETMLGFHHGHKVRNESLPLLFAAQFPEAWGRTKRRAIHCGHRHHCDEKEYNGVTVVQHPTIAARDAYAARGGWIADRAVQSITYSKKYGQVGRVFVTPEMLRHG